MSLRLHKPMKPLFACVYTRGFACGELAGKWLFGNRPFTVIPNGFHTEKFRSLPLDAGADLWAQTILKIPDAYRGAFIEENQESVDRYDIKKRSGFWKSGISTPAINAEKTCTAARILCRNAGTVKWPK